MHIYNQSLHLCDASSLQTNDKWFVYMYPLLIASSVFILSILSNKLAGNMTTTTKNVDIFKRRNRFVEEIEKIKRWGNSLKPNVIYKQDWKLDWTSNIRLGIDNNVEAFSTVFIHYKKTQIKTLTGLPTDQYYSRMDG